MEEKEKLLKDLFLFIEKKRKLEQNEVFLERYKKYPELQEPLNNDVPVEATIRGLRTKNRILSKERDELKGQLYSLEQELFDLEERCSEIKQNKLKERVETLKKEVRNTSDSCKKYKQKIKELEKQIYFLQQDKQALEKQIELGKVLLLKKEVYENEKNQQGLPDIEISVEPEI